MLDRLDLGLRLDSADYKQQIQALMLELAELQRACWQARIPVVVVLEGWAASGKGALVRKLTGYMDPRGFRVHPIWPATPEERRHPFLWRFWSSLPPRGAVAIFYHSWYGRVLEDRLFERIEPLAVPAAMGQINAFERQLVDDGAAIAKFWMHVDRDTLKSRLRKARADELQAWRIRPEDLEQAKRYRRYAALAEEMLTYTSSGHAPWTLVEAHCRRWAQVKVFSSLVATLREALERRRVAQALPPATPQAQLGPMEPDWLARVDLSQTLAEDEYRAQLGRAQLRLLKLQKKIFKWDLPVLVMFEGWDAAGKGGAIQRLTAELDPRSFAVHTFSAPSAEELRFPYLWRFWRALPTAGRIGILDRSWYGRVLVERVEGLATEPEWQRAYQEINEFESQLVDFGMVVVKIWLQISPEVQLQRFEERRDSPFKHYKLTDEDWRNREKWPLYAVAVNQMLQRTSTAIAPWTLVPANDKYFARVRVIEAVAEAIEAGLARR